VANVQIRRTSKGERVLAGVAAGVARVLSVPAIYVRIAFVLLAGVSIPVYLLLWALLPADDGSSGLLVRLQTEEESDVRRGVAFGSIVLGVVLLLRRLGVWFPQNWLWPMVLVAAGLAMVWKRPERNPASKGPSMIAMLADAKTLGDVLHVLTSNWNGSRRASAVRLVVGAMLVLLGVGANVASGRSLSTIRDALFGGLFLMGGMALILGPWLVRLLKDLNGERRARARADAQAEIATHLHDSVLQTLAIIQRRADQPREIVTLARRQERELRAWLYGGTEVRNADDASTVGEALEAVVDELEEAFGIRVEVVKVGDAPISEVLRALILAGREAMVNAAKHAGVDEISVYLEVSPREVELFVRDRGVGFDQAQIADDRHGLRDSITSRIERLHGKVNIVSAIGAGTEVQLTVPRRDNEQESNQRDGLDQSMARPADQTTGNQSAANQTAANQTAKQTTAIQKETATS
jgi:signal transduction histidine kinase